MAKSQPQKSVKINPSGTVETTTSEIPQLKEDEVLVRVACVAINPVDGKSADLSPTPGATLGFDYSGEVIALGTQADEGVTRPLTIGDRVFGCVFGNNPDRPDNGSFAEYVAVPANLALMIPSHMSFEEAATLGVGLATVGLALYQSLNIPTPFGGAETPSGPRHVLIYGGSTATGTLAIQMIKQYVIWQSLKNGIPFSNVAQTLTTISPIFSSGFIPIATCSPDRADLLKSRGVTAVFDYHSPTCGSQIREFTGNKLAHVIDCITDTSSMRICYEALSQAGGRYVSLDPFPIRGHTRRTVRPSWVLSLTMFGQPVGWKRPFKRDAQPRDRKFAREWFQTAQKLLNSGDLKPHPFEVRTGGLEQVPEGIDAVRKGKIQGKKLVYNVKE